MISTTSGRGAPLLVVLCVLFGAGMAAGVDPPHESEPAKGQRSGEQIFHAACASCHGDEGRGMPQPHVGFDTPLPDFSDCSFSTREPDGDWGSVVHGGGPVRVFDRMMPAFGDVLGEAEIQKALDHVRGFCDERKSWPRGELNLPRPLLTAKAFPEDEAVLSTTVAAEGKGAVMSKLIYEMRLGARGQIEVVLPFGFLDTDDSGWTGGLGDVVLATKWALLHSFNTGSIFSLALEGILPSGREDRGLGKGVTILEPFWAFGQILPADGFVHLQGGAEISTEPDKVHHELFVRAALGMSFAQGALGHGRTWTPMVELASARELEEGASFNWDVIPQLQVTLSTRQHVMLAVGARLPINDFDARTSQVLMYLLWDWFDGSFFEGW